MYLKRECTGSPRADIEILLTCGDAAALVGQLVRSASASWKQKCQASEILPL